MGYTMKLKYYLRGLGIGILVTAIVMSITTAGEKESLSDAEIIERARALGMTESVVLSELGTGEETLPEDMPTLLPEEEPDADDVAIPTADADEGVLPTADAGETALPTTDTDDVVLPSAEPEESTLPLPDADETSLPSAQPGATASKSEPSEPPTATPSPTAVPQQTPGSAAGPSTAGMGLPAEDGKEVTIIINSGEGSFTVCRRLEEVGLISSAAEYDDYLYENGYDKKLRVGNHIIPPGADLKMIADILSGNS